MPNDEIYQDREQSLVKHHILRKYLRRFAPIVGSGWNSITYVDCFAGPWNTQSPDLRDSSFAIALEELRRARQTHADRGRTIQLRCFFLEKDRRAYDELQSFASRIQDAEVKVLNSSFENSVGEILRFVGSGGARTFPFIFIDPTGWTGFSLQTITPLLRLRPGEVLINFMTGHIRRFLDLEQSRQSFEDLFGSQDFRAVIQGLSGIELEDAAVSEYMKSVKTAGGFEYVLPAIVLHPEINRTHFHLIYATRHPRGVEVFKSAEKSAMEEMERVRAEAQQRHREERSRQPELFRTQESPESRHYNELRERYLERAKQNVLSLLRQRRRVPYDEAWAVALSLPLVWESDVKQWIREWQNQSSLGVEGLMGSARVPSREQNNILVWRGQG
ncbi:MAG TPA: three-Cys-motif partner protein TcmP [Thermoanaerobaculia bacterium]